MKSHLRHLCILGLILPLGRSLYGQATIEGTVKLPKPRSADVVSQRYDLAGDPGVIIPDPPSAVVYLEGDFPAPKTPPQAEMAQKNLEFVTPLLAVQVGTVVSFPNLDDTYHNIFSYSKSKRFDLGRYKKEETPVPTVTFDKEGAIVLHCDIHEHMRAIVLVVATPYFKKTDLSGAYKLGNLPAGHFKLKAWIDSKNIQEREVDLKSGVTLHIDFP